MVSAIVIWGIGWMFSIGLCFDETKGKDGFIVTTLMLIFWPAMLGCVIRENIGWQGK